jgi:anti-sigma regulatory factor (Ser/Thr protein kinase)
MHHLAKTVRSANAARLLDERTLFCSSPSDLGVVEGMCKLVRHFLMNRKLSELLFATEVVVRECLNNAILHGNQGDAEKRLSLAVVAESHRVMVRVADEGEGFDWQEMQMRVPDSSAASGRGLAMVGFYASKVSFNRAGNEITVELGKTRARGAKK